MKIKFLSLLLAIGFVGTVSAQTKCTVTTSCKTQTYEGSVNAVNNSGTVVVTDADGKVIDTFECDDIAVGTSCSATSTGGSVSVSSSSTATSSSTNSGNVSATGSVSVGTTATDRCARIKSPRFRALLGCDNK